MDGSAGGRTLKQNENRKPVHSGEINFRKMGAVTRTFRGPDGTEIEKQLRIQWMCGTASSADDGPNCFSLVVAHPKMCVCGGFLST